MDMNGQWPVSPWDFASGPSRSYSQPARSPILHRSRSPASVCAMVNATHVNRDTLLYSQPCQESNMPKTVLCQVQYIAQRLFAPFPLLIEWGFLKSFNTGRNHQLCSVIVKDGILDLESFLFLFESWCYAPGGTAC